MASGTLKPIVVIVGETAAGKSRLAINIAQKFNGEIICADSWTVRQELNIGTAKPTLAQQKAAKHHLLDIVEPCEPFSAAVFKRLASKTIKDIIARGKLPIIVGGSGLYVDAIIFNYSFLKPSKPAQRAKLNSMPLNSLIQKAESLGLDLSGIDLRNKRRVIRLIEVGGMRPKQSKLRVSTLVLGIKPTKDFELDITSRVEEMFQKGLEGEVKKLSSKYGWDCEGLLGIGYREWQNYFEGTQSLDQTKQRIIANTKKLAKKQRTWFKRHNFIQWVSDPRETVDKVTTFLNKNNS